MHPHTRGYASPPAQPGATATAPLFIQVERTHAGRLFLVTTPAAARWLGMLRSTNLSWPSTSIRALANTCASQRMTARYKAAVRRAELRSAWKQLSLENFWTVICDVYTTSARESKLDTALMPQKSTGDVIGNIGDSVDIPDALHPIYNFKASG